MNIRQQKFAEGLVAGKTQTQAAIDAGYSEKSATVQGSIMFRNPDIQRYVQAHRAAAGDKAEVSLEWVLKKLAEEARNAPDAGDRIKALETLGKALGAFVERSEVHMHGDHTVLAVRAEELMRKVMEAPDPEPLLLEAMQPEPVEG